MKLLINDLNEIKRRLTSEKLSLYPLVLSFTLATSRILNVFMSTVRVDIKKQDRGSRCHDQHQTNLVPFSNQVVIFDNFHHFLAFPSAMGTSLWK